MPHVLSARASSLGASTILIGALLAVALTATHTVWSPFAPSPPPIESVTERPPEPLPPPPPAHTSATPQTQDFTTISFPALPTFDGPPTPSLDPTPLGAGPVEITNPSWLHRPSGLERFYPRRALERGIEGRAMLDCLVSATGALSCTVVSETPARWGFGAAAQAIAAEYRMQPAMRDGLAVPGRYRMDVPFSLR